MPAITRYVLIGVKLLMEGAKSVRRERKLECNGTKSQVPFDRAYPSRQKNSFCNFFILDIQSDPKIAPYTLDSAAEHDVDVHASLIILAIVIERDRAQAGARAAATVSGLVV